MPIKNYTTTVDVFTSLGEIQGSLAKHGATKIMIDYENGKPSSLTFALNGPRGLQGFVLPALVDGTLRAFAKQKVKPDRTQAEKTAWRNTRDWVMAQMAFIEASDVPIDQVFLPYLTDKTGRSLYDVYASGQLQLTE
jgi:hypothetical protein